VAELLTVSQLGLRLYGRHLRGRCPFHRPEPGHSATSFSFTPKDGPDTGPFQCFSCGASGIVVAGAVVPAGERVPEGLSSGGPVVVPEASLVPRVVDAALSGAFAVMQDLYTGSEAERYIRGRALGDVAGAGYIPGGGFHFPSDVDLECLGRLHMVRPDGTPTPMWQHRVVLPYCWVDGRGEERITSLFGRSLTPESPRRLKHMYSPGGLDCDPERWLGRPARGDLAAAPFWFRGVFNPGALRGKVVRPVEGALDCLGAMRLGLDGPTALGGTAIGALLRRGAVRSDAQIVWSLDNGMKWARERDEDGCRDLRAGVAAEEGRGTPDEEKLAELRRRLVEEERLPRQSAWHRAEAAFTGRITQDLPPRLREGCKDWVDVCGLVAGGDAAALRWLAGRRSEATPPRVQGVGGATEGAGWPAEGGAKADAAGEAAVEAELDPGAAERELRELLGLGGGPAVEVRVGI
jgi:hypothetical protein